jgi:hypothetical protein
MKTAMQELREWVDTELKLLNYEHSIILAKIDFLLEKEKEQIIKAANQKIAGDEMLDLLYFPNKEAAKSKGEAYYRLIYEGKTNRDENSKI